MKKSQLKKIIKEEIKSTLNEGIWKVGTEEEIQTFIDEVQNLQSKYWNIVGSDAVHNGLDTAIGAADELKDIARGDYKHHTKVDVIGFKV